MERMVVQRVGPLLKCVVLFLFIFTAKVLTSRPLDGQDAKHEIQQSKPSHYVRTFTKYHHRRTQWNLPKSIEDDWPLEYHKVKRSVEDLNNEFFITDDVPNLNEHASNTLRDNIIVDRPVIGRNEHGSKNGLTGNIKVKDRKEKVEDKGMRCLYKINNVVIGVTQSYDDEKNQQWMVESDSFGTGQLSDEMRDGSVVQIEQCTDPKAYCYTLWHQHEENSTVLGQGCWRNSQNDGRGDCDNKCVRTPQLPGAKFCCCSTSYCNRDYASLREETVTMKVKSTIAASTSQPSYSSLVASGSLAAVFVLLTAAVLHRLYCRTRPKDELSDDHVEKGDIMGSGPDALATGLLCVDNLTLIEHIGQGKFGSVWRGSLGSSPVAVKLYSSASTWQREAAIYGLPHLSHSNILRYYGSDTRPTLTEGGGREHLIVLELCSETLRTRLERAPLSWVEFATLAHGLAAALAHLHSATGLKPCVVHRDVNSNNVLISMDGRLRLADLGLAQLLHARSHNTQPDRIAEAGTLRYLAPEALEGALDLSGARAALCAVDVFALGLVLWEMLWRTAGAHPGPAPPYARPYHHHGLPQNPTLAQMQSLVSRNKARPPLPKGPVAEARALKIAAETCDECWDHDAEARLTAVCVEERMAELRQMLQAHGPVIHDNNLHPHHSDSAPPPPEADKNSNCTAPCDVSTPLLRPAALTGRNACLARNTHAAQQSQTTLVHKSLKDITLPIEVRPTNVEENCLSVARVSHIRTAPEFENTGLNEIRSYQRPLDYVQNDVSNHDSLDRGPKQTNLLHDVKVEKPKWGIKRFFEKKFGKPMETEVKLVPETSQRTMTSIINEKVSNVNFDRPSNLVLNQDRTFYEPPCLSPPNRTLSPAMMMESEMRSDKVFSFKELPNEEPKTQNQIFAVIVPKAKPESLIEMKSKSRSSSESINKLSVRNSVSSQSMNPGHSESEDSTLKKRLSCDNRIITSNSGRSSRASINLELQYIEPNQENDSPFDLNSDCSSSEDEHLMLLSENGTKITMQTIIKPETEKKKFQNEVLKESSQKAVTFNKFQNKYTNFDNEFSDPNDKENLVNGYSGDNPVYLAALNGEIMADLKLLNPEERSPKPSLKSLTIKRQHSLEQVSEIFSSSGDISLQNPAGRVKTPGDLPVAIRRARRDRALQKGRASECNRLSLYDDRMMFGNSL